MKSILVQISLLPNTKRLKGTLDLSSRREIEIAMGEGASQPGCF